MRAKIITDLKEMRATELEAYQETIEAVAKHCDGKPHVKATHMLTALHSWASMSSMESLKKQCMRRPSKPLAALQARTCLKCTAVS
jgi:hypothetical protein